MVETPRHRSPIWSLFQETASRYSEKAAIIDASSDQAITYGELALKVNERSQEFSELNAGLLIIEGDETFDDLISLLACAKAEISILFTNSSNKSDNGIYRLLPSCSRVVLLRCSTQNRNREGLGRENAINISSGQTVYARLELEREDKESLNRIPDSAYLLTCSSGSTGTPKMIWFSQSTILARTLQSVRLFEISAEDRILACSPLLHSLGQRHCFISMLTGATYIRSFPFNRDNWKLTVDSYSPSFWIPVSTHLSILKDDISTSPTCMNSFRAISSSSSPIEPSLLANITSSCNTQFSEIYGTTETACATYLRPYDENVSSVGQLIPGSQVRIDDPNEEGIGEIVIKNECMLDGYIGLFLDDYLTHDGFFMSGDLGMIDDNGYLYYYGRKKESFNVLGKLVCSSQIENAVLGLGLVYKCQIYPIETSLFGTLLGLIIESDSAEVCREIGAALRRLLPKEYLPAKIIHLRSFPLLSNGKQDRLAVRKLAKEHV